MSSPQTITQPPYAYDIGVAQYSYNDIDSASIVDLPDHAFDDALARLEADAKEQRAAHQAALKAASKHNSLTTRLQKIPLSATVKENSQLDIIESSTDPTGAMELNNGPTLDELTSAVYGYSVPSGDERNFSIDTTRVEYPVPASREVMDYAKAQYERQAVDPERLRAERELLAGVTIAELEHNRTWLTLEEYKAAATCTERATYAAASEANYRTYMELQGVSMRSAPQGNLGVMGMLKKLIGDFDDIPNVSLREQKARIGAPHMYDTHELMRIEGIYGGQIFDAYAPPAPGVQRAFFCLDGTSWLYHEEGAMGADGKALPSTTIRYEIQGAGILKWQQGAKYSYLEGKELSDFVWATDTYYRDVTCKLYHQTPYADLPGAPQDYALAA